MLSHQLTGQHFKWKSVPAPAAVSIRFIDSKIGFGVFAEQDMADGEFIGEYTGKVISETAGEDFSYLHSYPSLTWGQEDVLLVVDALTMGNETRFINHSDSGGLSHKEDYFFNGHWHILYKVGSAVVKGEQLFVNYGEGYWKGQPEPPVSLSP
jgi:histone-lysine N-methyltransferase EZH2